MKIDFAIRWIISFCFLVFIILWSLTANGCNGTFYVYETDEREQCETACENAEMVLVEMMFHSAAGPSCVCGFPDPE